METERNVKPKEQQRFAEELAARLESARVEPDFEHLILVVSPEFLGMLRSKLTNLTSDCVVASINKDLTRATAAEIASHLPA